MVNKKEMKISILFNEKCINRDKVCVKVETIMWISIIVLFILSFIALIVPILPGVLLIWGAFLIYHMGLADNGLSLWFWLVMIGFTLLLFVADFITNHYFVQRLGGTKASQWGALFGVVIGIFVYPPVGLFAVPFVIVFLIELSYEKTVKEAAFAALGTLAGFLSGTIAKGMIQIVMICLFAIDIWLG